MTTQIPNSMLVSPGGVSDATARAQATAAQTTADSKATLQIGTLAASTTSAPNATAVMAAIAAGTGGAATTLRTAATNAIPLDTAGNGRAMPLVAGQTILINAPTTLTIAAGAIEGASCEATYYVASTITLPTTYPGIPAGAAVIVNGTLTVGFRYRLVFGISAGDLVIFCFQQAAVDVVAPTLLSASVANATPAQIDLVFNSEALNATWSAAGAFVVVGHTSIGITRSTATTGFLTVSPAFVNGESARTLTYAQPGTNNMQDLAGNLLVNFTGATITNNTATPAPVFISATPPAANVGTPYSFTYSASNATSFPLVSGTFPAGLTYTPATGNIAGTPTAVSAVVHMVSAVGPGGTTNGPSNTLTVNAASTPRTDTFTRANQAGLGTPSDAGSAWFGNTAVFSIVGNQVQCPAAGVGGVALLAGCPSNGTFMIDVTAAWGGTNYSIPGVVFRATDVNNYMCFRIAGDSTYVVESIVAGVATTLASGASGINTAAVASLKVVTSGTSILCYYIQGGTTVLVSTVTSSQFQTATSAGIFDYQSGVASITLDNFSAA